MAMSLLRSAELRYGKLRSASAGLAQSFGSGDARVPRACVRCVGPPGASGIGVLAVALRAVPPQAQLV